MGESPAVEQKRIVIRGYVQGVGFRFYARRVAVSLGLTGTVRNRADGAVEAVIQGAPARLAQFIAAMKRGPEGCIVQSIDVCDENPDPAVTTFSIVG